jgi:hypothetical protein
MGIAYKIEKRNKIGVSKEEFKVGCRLSSIFIQELEQIQ